MIKVEIATIQVSLVSPHRVLVFKEVEGERYLPIWIGACETEAISMSLQGIEPPRPLTHDLIVELLDTLGARLEYVFVNELANDTFRAQLTLNVEGEERLLDCRPSDAAAIAVRLQAPIYVHEKVMEQAGIVSEPGLLEEYAADQGLDVFRDFLNQLNLDNMPTD